jgi:hypothetical protein
MNLKHVAGRTPGRVSDHSRRWQMQDTQPTHDQRLGVSECMRTIEPLALRLLGNTHVPSVDFECLLHAILSGGTAAGWSEGEVRLALRAVVAHLQPAELIQPEYEPMSEHPTEHSAVFDVRCS